MGKLSTVTETNDSEEEVFLTQSSFNGSSNRGNELEKFVSSNNRQVDHKNAQFNVEEATEGLPPAFQTVVN